MIDPGIFNNLGVGGALLAALWLVLKYKPWKDDRASRAIDASGEKSVEFWEKAIEEAVEEGIKKAMAGRNEELRKNVTDIIIADLRSTRHDLRDAMQTAIASAYQLGKRQGNGD
jgi:hypothetical protein